MTNTRRQKLTYEQTVKRLHQHYQRQMKALAKIEKKSLETGIREDRDKALELKGYLRGIKRTLSFVNNRMADQELDLRMV